MFVPAVLALLSGSGGGPAGAGGAAESAGTAAEASAWLERFGATPEAWRACSGVMCSGSGASSPGMSPAAEARPEVLYFVANMLYSKVRREWGVNCPEAEQKERGDAAAALASVALPQLIAQVAKAEAEGAPGAWRLVLARVCLVLGGIASRSESQIAGGFVDESMGVMGGSDGGEMSAAVRRGLEGCVAAGIPDHTVADVKVWTALTLMSSFADEAKALDRARLCGVGLGTEARVPAVLSLIENVLRCPPRSPLERATAGQVPGASTARKEAAACLTSWLEMRAAGDAPIPLAQFAASSPTLLVAVLDMLEDDDSELVERTCDALELLMKFVPALDEAACGAIGATASALMRQQGRLGACSDEAIGGYCRVAQAIAEGATEIVSGTVPGSETVALGLAKFVLECAALDDRPTSITEAAAEYFMLLNTLSLDKRHEQLREPLFNEILMLCMRRVQFGPEYDNMENVDPDDFEAFTRFREQTMSDIMGQAHGILKVHYLRVCGQAIANTSSWQAAEAGIFALRCAAQNIKMRFYADRAGQAGAPPEERAETVNIIEQIFSIIIVGEGARTLTSNELSISHCAMLIASFAFWFAKHPNAPIEAGLVFCIRALLVGRAKGQAAVAFKALCARCADVLTADRSTIAPVENLLSNSEKVLSQMMTAPRASGIGTPASASTSATISDNLVDEKMVVEGLGRLLSTIQRPEDASRMARKLCHPFVHQLLQVVQHLQQLRAHQPGSAFASLAMTTGNTLHLFSAAVRFLDLRVVNGQHPVMAMLEEVWPALSAIGSNEEMRSMQYVVDGLCELVECVMKSVGPGSAPLLPVLLDTVLPVCEMYGFPSTLDTFATAAEILGDAGDPAINSALHRAAISATSSSMAILQKTGIPESPELTRALLEMTHRFAMFAPATILASLSLVQMLVQMSIAAGGCRETELARSAYFFLGLLLSPGEKAMRHGAWKDNYESIRSVLRAEGAGLVCMTLRGLAETAPRQLYRQLSGILFHGIDVLGHEAFLEWATRALLDPEFPGVRTGHLTTESSRMFLDLVLKRPGMHRGRFDALAADFAGICRGESTPDVLIAYAM